MTISLDITPMPYKRMTRFSKFNAEMQGYYAWRDSIRLLARSKRFELPDRFVVTFLLPMPPSWSQKKRDQLEGQPHQQKPDTNNLAKALEDALRDDDEKIWNVSATKLWAVKGGIQIQTYE